MSDPSFRASLKLYILYALGPLVALPTPAMKRRLARGLVHLFLRTLSGPREAIRENLQIAGGGALDSRRIDRIVRRLFTNYGLYLGDYFALPWQPRERVLRLFGEPHGKEHFEAARAAGRGVLLVGPHVGSWELAGYLMRDLGCPVHALSIRDPYPHFDRFRAKFRDREGIRIIHVGDEVNVSGLVEIQAALGRGEAVAMLGDRLYMGRAFRAPFFGRAVRFPAGPIHIAALTGASIVPFAAVRDGERYVVEMTDRIEVREASRRALDAAGRRLVSSFELLVRRHPDQWYNFHPVFREEGLSEWRW